ncbi:MAG: nitrogen fixation protein FixH [Cypionkella sp.]|uniref:FixH family protein n=1 Tax=Cypionkella sp. TaxID=2811411 RepID=UPI0026023287|nr:FixH family protein [Cypionkella sp.]MDB5658142.1 nitrogen fixation protein FixH [Cypionkella sp.]
MAQVDARELTGRHVLAITVCAFSVIIGVNITLAYQAVSTFPGLEVSNSYVASQTFDADRKAQQRLGWTLATSYDAGHLLLTFRDAQGLAAHVQGLDVLVGRTTEARDDTQPVFVQDGGVFVAPLALHPGKWMLRVQATAPDGTAFRQRIDLFVKG